MFVDFYENIPLLSILVSALTTLVAISFLQTFARNFDLLDIPDARKTHHGSVPLVGGIAMYIGLIVGISLTSNNLSELNYFIIASGIILILGVLDDFYNASVLLRIIIQILVAIFIIIAGDINIESFGSLFGGGGIFLHNWSYFLSVIAIITAMNALNMVDGIHGLAGISSLITFLAILYVSMDTLSQEIIFFLFLMSSVLPVFLIYNLCLGVPSSKRIFMGDAGSMFIGLTIVWALIKLSQGDDRAFAPVTALWLFCLPLLEIFTAIFRRFSSGNSPFKPDLFHSHHLLKLLGLGEKTILLALSAFSFLMAIIGVLGEVYEIDEWKMFVSFLLVFLIHFFVCVTISKNSQLR
jgi:UDP-GlcNAc:undecaprenyl-phosphate/decaprenyl-phosphate GlcNAc-1-phosphate transferase